MAYRNFTPDALNELKDFILNTYHRVGTYYLSEDPTNPSEIIGGKWIPIENKFIYTAGTKSAGETGGSKKITINNLPKHNHSIKHVHNGTTETDGKHKHLIKEEGGYRHTISNNPEIEMEYARYLNNIKHLIINTDSNDTDDTIVFKATELNSEHKHKIILDEADPSTSGNTGKNEDYMPEYIVAYCWKRKS